jgi:hypothetical protein
MVLWPDGANIAWERLPNPGRFLSMQQRGQLLDPASLTRSAASDTRSINRSAIF